MSKKTKIIIGIAIGLLVMACAAYGITVYMSHTVRTKPTVPMAEPSTVTDAEEVTEETVADKDATEQKKTDKPDAKDKVDKDEKTTEAAKDKETKKEDTTEAKKDGNNKKEDTTEKPKKETTTEAPKNDSGNKQQTTEAPKKETSTEAPKKEAAKKAPAKKAAAPKKAAAKKAPAKKAATKAAAPKKVAAAKENIFVQFGEKSYSTEDLVKIAKDVWVYDLGKKLADFKTVEIYVKPFENVAYYVINETESGSFGI